MAITAAAASLIAAGIGAAASGASTGASIAATGNINRKNRKWQRRMYDLQLKNNREDSALAFERQIEMMGLQQQQQLDFERLKYGQMMKGIKENGLNPGLAMGIGGTGGQGGASVPQTQAPSAGNPQSFAPQIFDISAAAKNIAEAKLAEATAKKEEGLTEKINDEREAIQQSIAESKKKIEKMDSEINLNNLGGEWQSIQNNIAKATEKEQINITKWNLKNIRQNFYNELARIDQADRELDIKEELKDSLIKYQSAQTRLTLLQAYGQKIQNGKELMGFQSTLRILEETANKIAAEAKNEKEFNERWKREIENKEWGTQVEAFKAANKNIYTTAINAYWSVFGSNVF